MDGSLQFGDVGVLLNLNPKSKSIADLVPELNAGEIESIDTFIIDHSSGVRVLLAPPSPEAAEHVTAGHAKRVLERLRAEHDVTIVDCPATFNDTTLAILDEADIILTILSLEITSIKNMRLFMEVTDQLGYGSDKIRIVLNRADAALGIRVSDVENSIGRKAQVSQDILRLANDIVGAEAKVAIATTTSPSGATAKKSLFAWR
jgi:pilus assembly protein CpaE